MDVKLPRRSARSPYTRLWEQSCSRRRFRQCERQRVRKDGNGDERPECRGKPEGIRDSTKRADDEAAQAG